MEFTLKYNQTTETRQLNENYTIKDLLDDLELSAQTTVANDDKIQLVQIIYGG